MAQLEELCHWMFRSARDGKLQLIRTKLSQLPEKQVKVVVESIVSGTTPLVIACRNGHFELVEYLISVVGANIEAPGAVVFDGETIEGAPPLWSAAAAGHFNIVRYLVEHGSDVNNTTFTNSTPLRAASFDGHFKIVVYLVDNGADIEIANRHGHTCLMIACYKGHHDIVEFLVDRKADIDRCSLKGNTALHDCAESGSLRIMKLLITSGAQMAQDSYGMTPLLAAAVTGHVHIVEYLLKHQTTKRLEKTHALELLGATFIDKKRDMMGALVYWRRALQERSNELEPLEKPNDVPTVEAYENTVEFRNTVELNGIADDPDQLRMQALVMRERILGPTHPDTSYYIRYRGAVYADLGDFQRCIKLWLYALEMQLKSLEPMNLMTQSSFLSFAELFSFMTNVSHTNLSRYVNGSKISSSDLMFVTKNCIIEVGHAMMNITSGQLLTSRDKQNHNRLIIIAMHMLHVISGIIVKMSEEDCFTLKTLAYRFVSMRPTTTAGSSPLHLACSKETSSIGRYPVCPFPSLKLTRLLLEVGASATDIDLQGNTALHQAASNKPLDDEAREIVRKLLEHGAHIDSVNKKGERAADLLTSVAMCDIVKPLEFQTLKCLAARIIRLHDIPYADDVPKSLVTFIADH